MLGLRAALHLTTPCCGDAQVKELEQKLELERSSARRHESHMTRLRHQLERLQDEKTEDVSHKSNDALNRAQKQIRELRGELQEAERKEQEVAKKRRNTVSSGELVVTVTKLRCPHDSFRRPRLMSWRLSSRILKPTSSLHGSGLSSSMEP